MKINKNIKSIKTIIHSSKKFLFICLLGSFALQAQAGDQVHMGAECQLYGGPRTTDNGVTNVALPYVDNTMLVFKAHPSRINELLHCPIDTITDIGHTLSNLLRVTVYGGPYIRAQVCFHSRYLPDQCGPLVTSNPSRTDATSQALYLTPPDSTFGKSSMYLKVYSRYARNVTRNTINEYRVQFR